jgi:hypothetical protein
MAGRSKGFLWRRRRLFWSGAWSRAAELFGVWCRHFAIAALASYGVILIAAFSDPAQTRFVVGPFGLGELGRIACLVVGVAWASAYTLWQYARQIDNG